MVVVQGGVEGEVGGEMRRRREGAANGVKFNLNDGHTGGAITEGGDTGPSERPSDV